MTTPSAPAATSAGAIRPATAAPSAPTTASPLASVWQRQTFGALLEGGRPALLADTLEAPPAAWAGAQSVPVQLPTQAPVTATVSTASPVQAGEGGIAALAQAATEAALTLRDNPLAAAPAIALRVGGALAGTTLWLSRRGDGWGLSVNDARREQRQWLREGEDELTAQFSSAGLGSLQLEFIE